MINYASVKMGLNLSRMIMRGKMGVGRKNGQMKSAKIQIRYKAHKIENKIEFRRLGISPIILYLYQHQNSYVLVSFKIIPI
jgi:hypothetical protein